MEEIQTRFLNLRNDAMDALVDLIHDIKQAKEAGATDAVLESPRDCQRQASFYIDFVMSENSMGFHADGECLRVLGNAINLCRKGQLALRAMPVAMAQNCRRRSRGQIESEQTMRLTRASDYAIRVLVYLTEIPQSDRATRRDIIENTGVPGAFLNKLVQRLVRAQFISARRGVGGGCTLAAPAAGISVLQV